MAKAAAAAISCLPLATLEEEMACWYLHPLPTHFQEVGRDQQANQCGSVSGGLEGGDEHMQGVRHSVHLTHHSMRSISVGISKLCSSNCQHQWQPFPPAHLEAVLPCVHLGLHEHSEQAFPGPGSGSHPQHWLRSSTG